MWVGSVDNRNSIYRSHENPLGHFIDRHPIAVEVPYMPAKFTPLTRLIILPHVSGSMARYMWSIGMASEINGLATLCRVSGTPA